MSREITRKDKREAGGWVALFIGLAVLYQVVLGWDGWLRLLAVTSALAGTAVLMFITGFARGFLRDTWPATHHELAAAQVQLAAGGYRKDGCHRWWNCLEDRPHVHMTHEDGSRLILIWNGVTVLDDQGRVLRHEP